jgi:hypothetical protein
MDMPHKEVSDIEIAADDSIYVFVTVNINPNAANLPFVVRGQHRDIIQWKYPPGTTGSLWAECKFFKEQNH